MEKELLFYDEVNARQYLSQLMMIYPYDIEEDMVYSLLQEHTYPHPVLLDFISYFENIAKFHILSKKTEKNISLQELFLKMSALSLNDDGVLHPHHFDFQAVFQISQHTFSHPYAHLPFYKIPFIDEVHLHDISLLKMNDYEECAIHRKNSFIYRDISMDAAHFVAVSIQITQKHGLIFLSRECLSLAIPLRAMFHVSPPAIKQDFILIFGLSDARKRMEYYFDETNELYIGLVSGDASMHHFLHLKNMILTLYNALRIHQQDLPIHASMLNITLHKQTYGILFAGESGTGKSEMLEACMHLCQKEHIPCKALFDDHGTLHYLDNEVVSTAIEISACIQLRTRSLEDIFSSFHESIFLQEERGDLYQITPVLRFDESVQFHKVTHIVYLDNTRKDKKISRIKNPDTCRELFEKGEYKDRRNHIVQSYFFNGCGCEADDTALCDLVHTFITMFYVADIPVFHIFTDGTALQKQHMFHRFAHQLLQEIGQ